MNSHEEIEIYLEDLYQRHRELDIEIQLLYDSFASDLEVNRLKTKKLWLKDEIHLYESKLKAIQ